MRTIEWKWVRHGAVCFTFDDRNFADWLNAMPLFERHQAHASFFVSGAMNEEALATMTTLRDAGHTVGLHTFSHAAAPELFEQRGADAYLAEQVRPQLDACHAVGLAPRSFSYPNNRRDERTDEYLSRYFARFRAGLGSAGEEEIFIPMEKLAAQRVMHGCGIGDYYHTVREELLEKLRHAAETNTCVTFFSHDISARPSRIGMPTALLKSCLQTANELGMIVAGFDELP